MLADELSAVFLFDGLDAAQLRALVEAGEEIHFEDGQVLFREGEPADYLWVLLEGRIDLLRRVGREETVMRVMDHPGLWAGGFRAWSDEAGYLATGRGAQRGRAFRVPGPDLGRLVTSWFPFGRHMIEGIFQTVRAIEATARQREALIALGTLAAGLAHEINNPAAAAVRAVDALRGECDTMLTSLVRLAEMSLTAEQFVALDRLRRTIDAAAAGSDPLAVADREDEISAWLERRDVEDGWRLAPALAAAGVDLVWCERAAEVLGSTALGVGLAWVASTISAATLLSETEQATKRVSELVAAVKSYSQMDRSSTQVIDVTEGLESTLVMLGHKLRSGVEVVREYAPDVPRIEAHPGELNQVWTNLIDNAVDAMDGRGTLRLATRLDGDSVVVEIADTGRGMPPEVQAHAFEPFFTTKDVGKGSGLGLDIARRIVVERHGGEISIESRPGATLLRVRIPRHAVDAER